MQTPMCSAFATRVPALGGGDPVDEALAELADAVVVGDRAAGFHDGRPHVLLHLGELLVTVLDALVNQPMGEVDADPPVWYICVTRGEVNGLPEKPSRLCSAFATRFTASQTSWIRLHGTVVS